MKKGRPPIDGLDAATIYRTGRKTGVMIGRHELEEALNQSLDRERKLREAIEPFRQYLQALEDYEWPARSYPDSGILHFNDIKVTRAEGEKLLDALNPSQQQPLETE